jgi:hypothetical protein
MADGYGDSLDYVSSQDDKREGLSQYQKRIALRKQAIGAKRKKADLAGRAVGTLREQAAQNQKTIRYGASQATAMGMQPGMGGGGGAIAAAGQVGRDAEMAGIAKTEQDTAKIMSAQQAAQDAELGAAEYEATQGTEDSDYSEAVAEGQTEAEQAIQDAQGFWNDDEEGALRKIRAMISRIRVKSPRAAAQLEDYYLRGEGARRIEEN